MGTAKFLFVGVGSIAKRHIRNLRKIESEQGLSFVIDAFRRNGGGAESVDHVYSDIASITDIYDAVFITNPTEKHLETLKIFHSLGKNFFIEKPVVSLDQLEEASSFELKSDAVYYVACPLRYNAVIKYIHDNINPSEVVSVRSISSSYLPDWRPGQDYRTTYSAHKSMGGGVSIDLIHEWDYLTYLFGWPTKVSGFIGKKSSLEIDSDDYAIYIAEYADKICELHLDYFGRKTIREVQLFTHDETIVGDIAGNKISFLKSGDVIDFNEERDDYQIRELKCFLDMISNKAEVENGFVHGTKVLHLTQGEVT